MNKVKRFIVLFLIVFLLSSSLSFFLVTRPRSLKNFDGSLLKQTAVSELGNDGGENGMGSTSPLTGAPVSYPGA